MALALADANRMIQAAIAKAEELNVNLSLAVCDAGGSLIAFNRMPGASAVSATVAQGKAAASAGFGRPSGALAADSPVIQAIISTMGGRMLPAQGAVPLYKDGELVGAIGGSGATAEQDEICAQAGSAALQRLHNGPAVWISRIAEADFTIVMALTDPEKRQRGGITKEMPLYYLAQEVRAARLYEGPTEVHRWVVARRLLRNAG